MFNKKTKFGEKFRSYVVTTKKLCVRNLKGFTLHNKKTIINKG